MKNITSLLLLVLIFCASCKEKNNDENTTNLSQATVYYGGDILTMEGESPEYAEALVVRDGKIEFVGDSKQAMEIAGAGHIMTDLKGKTLIPGLIDGHAHFSMFSTQAIGAQILPPPDAEAKDIPTL